MKVRLLVLKTYDVAELAHLDKAKLESEGVESFIQNENSVWVSPFPAGMTGEIRLMVNENDLPRALSILQIAGSGIE